MKVLSENSAIEKIGEGYSLSRFGDGELKMIWRKASINKLQDYDTALQEKLLRVFTAPLKKLLIGIPNPLCDRSWIDQFTETFEEFIADKPALKESTFVSAFFSRPSIVSLDSELYFEQVKRLWKGKEVVLINFNPSLLTHYLFDDSAAHFIWILRSNCFSEYKQILKACRSYYGEKKLFLVSAGPTASCLAYDLTRDGEQCVDIGQIALEHSLFKAENDVEKWTSQNSYKVKRGHIRVEGANKDLNDVKTNILHTREKLERRQEAGIVIDYGNVYRLVNAFMCFADYVDKSLPLLDIGTREGWFLGLLEKIGFKDVQAIEVSPKAVAVVKAKGLRITKMDGQKMQFQDKFGTITAIHVLEHCSNPQKMVDNVYKALKKGGVLYLEIPLEERPFPTNSAHFSSFPDIGDLFALFGSKWTRAFYEVISANKAGTKRVLRSVWRKES